MGNLRFYNCKNEKIMENYNEKENYINIIAGGAIFNGMY